LSKRRRKLPSSDDEDELASDVVEAGEKDGAAFLNAEPARIEPSRPPVDDEDDDDDDDDEIDDANDDGADDGVDEKVDDDMDTDCAAPYRIDAEADSDDDEGCGGGGGDGAGAATLAGAGVGGGADGVGALCGALLLLCRFNVRIPRFEIASSPT
jgi:hypothetical protein